MPNKIKTIQNVEYAVYDFYYVDHEDVFVFLRQDDEIRGRNCKIGEIYIVIPSWVEMQDIFQMSCEKNPMTQKYEIGSYSVYKHNRIKILCRKIVLEDGNSYFMDNEVFENMDMHLGWFIEQKVEDTMSQYYTDSGLTKAQEKMLSASCFDYYSAIYKQSAGKIVTVPPCPGVVLLLNICELFDCTPDVARKIPKRDIDMVFVAKEQEHICQKHPEMIGFGTR